MMKYRVHEASTKLHDWVIIDTEYKAAVASLKGERGFAERICMFLNGDLVTAFDQHLVQIIEAAEGDMNKAIVIAKRFYPDVHTGFIRRSLKSLMNENEPAKETIRDFSGY